LRWHSNHYPAQRYTGVLVLSYPIGENLTFAKNHFMYRFLAFFLLGCTILLTCCTEKANTTQEPATAGNSVKYASGLTITAYHGYTVVTVSNPWPNAQMNYTYVLKKHSGKVPDSLSKYPVIAVPVKKIVVTSTTHLPSLEMLGVENTLIGFPNLKYVSSAKIASMAKAGTVKELGANQSLNTELLLEMQPDVIVGFGIDNHNPALENLQRSGLKVIFNGDWNEQSPLGKAEWIKLFGVLFGKEKAAAFTFAEIEREYQNTRIRALSTRQKPSVLMGGMFENKWNVPRGNSWGATFINDASGKYFWQNTTGTGSLALPFETVLEVAGAADCWIGPGQYASLSEMLAANPHYQKFKAFQQGRVFTFKKGATGGIIYYESAPNRPDLVLKDVVKILHPALLPNHELYFFEKIKP
jgi:iron complex transport system substrate-binding protein